MKKSEEKMEREKVKASGTDQKGTTETPKEETRHKLPFVKKHNYWAPESTRDWLLNEVIGQQYALDYLDYIKSGGQVREWCDLDRIILGMFKAGEYGVVERSFISTLDAVFQGHGVINTDLPRYRLSKSLKTLSLLTMDIPKISKLRILDFLKKSKQDDAHSASS